MAKKTTKKKSKKTKKRPIEQYDHADKRRANNPQVGLVTPTTDPEDGKKTKYQYDPHLDPQLTWAGKAEHISFEVPTVSLHVHERIDPRTIIDAVRARNGSGHSPQMPLFESPDENPPLRDALDFYKHAHNWTNRLIAGDSLQIVNSLLEKEGMAGKVQMVYIDPPYGIRYGSNFQPFVGKRDVMDGKDDDLTQEPEMIRAFRDTWELGIHSYLTYLRDRLFLAKELLSESGSCFVQINDENVHYVRDVMAEVFGAQNFIVTILIKKKGGQKGRLVDPVNDYLVWFAKDIEQCKGRYHQLYQKVEVDRDLTRTFRYVELPEGEEVTLVQLSKRSPTNTDYADRPDLIERDFPGARLFTSENSTSGGFRRTQSVKFDYEGQVFDPGIARGNCWKHSAITEDGSPSGMHRMAFANRLFVGKGQLRFKRYINDFGYKALSNWWDYLGGAADPVYVVQTNPEIVKRCILMTTDPGDLVFDPTCGSGTTAYVAEQWGRRWITCDTSRVAITLAKQRLMASIFDYYDLAHPEEGVGSGFKYKTVPHIMSSTIANNPGIKKGMEREQIDALIAKYADPETLYDQPIIDKNRVRATGSFTVEAVPAPTVLPLGEIDEAPADDESVARTGPTVKQNEWRSELQKTGVRGRGGQRIEFSRVEPLGGTRYLHAIGETKETKPKRVVVSFGPEHAPLEQRQVEHAWEEARTLVPKPDMIVFASFQFDPEAAKDIDELTPVKTGMTFLKVQMNVDMLTEDLKKKRASNESFWLIGQPDVQIQQIAKGDGKGQWVVEVHGFDYYNPKKGTVESGDTSKIAMWMLDTDYDGRSLYPRQVFFPMAGAKDGWARLAKTLKAEIDQEKIEAYRGTKSLPFEPGEHKRAAVKIVDDRGIESLKILDLPDT